MLHKTLISGYVSTVGTNHNQIDFGNSVLCGSKYIPSLVAHQEPIKHPIWHAKTLNLRCMIGFSKIH